MTYIDLKQLEDALDRCELWEPARAAAASADYSLYVKAARAYLSMHSRHVCDDNCGGAVNVRHCPVVQEQIDRPSDEARQKSLDAFNFVMDKAYKHTNILMDDDYTLDRLGECEETIRSALQPDPLLLLSFEEWSQLGSDKYDLTKDPKGFYLSDDTRNAWTGWIAANANRTYTEKALLQEAYEALDSTIEQVKFYQSVVLNEDQVGTKDETKQSEQTRDKLSERLGITNELITNLDAPESLNPSDKSQNEEWE